MLNRIFYTFIIFLFWSALYAVDAHIVVTNATFGIGTYHNPYIICGAKVRFYIEVSGFGYKTASYWLQIHMDYYRSCATVWDSCGLSYSNTINREFIYKADMAGWYYLRVDINTGNGYYMQDFETMMMHVYFMVPPLRQDTTSIVPCPIDNDRPTCNPVLIDAISGNGTYGNPIILNDSNIRFYLDAYDPDGFDDIVNGVFLWAIHMHGYHPIYAKTDTVCRAKDTFLYFTDMWYKILECDIGDYTPDDGLYILYTPMIDRIGNYSYLSETFIKIDEDIIDTTPQQRISNLRISRR